MNSYHVTRKRRPVGQPYVFVTVKSADGPSRTLTQVVHHSPQGMDFGHYGDGPLDLALSILADFWDEQLTQAEIEMGVSRASATYRDFCREFVACVHGDHFHISAAEITAWANQEDDVKGIVEE